MIPLFNHNKQDRHVSASQSIKRNVNKIDFDVKITTIHNEVFIYFPDYLQDSTMN